MIKNVQLNNFRNFNTLDIEIASGNNVIIAPNGSGKSNFLESIYYSINGYSFRHFESIKDFIGPNFDFANIEISLEDGSSLQNVIKKTDNGIRKTTKLNGQIKKNIEFAYQYPILYFVPGSISIVDGDPSHRRSEFDNFLTIWAKDYLDYIEKYKHVLKNRNKLLQRISKSENKDNVIGEIDFWNDKLVEYGSQIILNRIDLVNSINHLSFDKSLNLFKNFYNKLKIENNFIEYKPSISVSTSIDKISTEEIKQIFFEKLKSNFQKELILQQTLYGPHRDDFVFKFFIHNLKFFGSRGQQRLGILFFKILQAIIYKERYGMYPFMLFDDLLSEMDSENSKLVLEFIQNMDFNFILTSSQKLDIEFRDINYIDILA